MPVISSQPDIVRVYRFQVYDGISDEMITSTRMATRETIERIFAVKTSISFEIPAAHVDASGFTEKNYVPVQGR